MPRFPNGIWYAFFKSDSQEAATKSILKEKFLQILQNSLENTCVLGLQLH